MEFILIDANQPFAVAIGLMLGLGLVEFLTSVVGFSASQLIDSFLPDSLGDADVDADLDVDGDIDLDADADVDADADAVDTDATGGVVVGVLGWLCIGRVPVLVLLVIFLTVFGLTGFVVQGAAQSTFGAVLAPSLASLFAFVVAVPSVRYCGLGIARVIPKVETAAVSSETFVGKVATLTLGTARVGHPAQAKLVDEHGQTHYVMVEPDEEGVEFKAGDNLVIVEQEGTRFRAIEAPREVLFDG